MESTRSTEGTLENNESTASSGEGHREAWKKVADLREQLDGADAVKRRVRGFILANPGQALAISAGIGFLLGFVVLRPR
ncbi:MAG TPA: hypothetical protein VHL58_05325 [Thermoanaerobaculia bacterium]|nr:hypothetical protein [Thermoanaerobaculia bacterium]